MKAEEVYAKLKKNIGLVSVEIDDANKETTNKIEALKTSQSLEYEGKNITCENTLTSRTSDVLINGQTYHNLIDYNDATMKGDSETTVVKSQNSIKATITKNGSSIAYFPCEMLKDNTVYTLLFNLITNYNSYTLTASFKQGKNFAQSSINIKSGYCKIKTRTTTANEGICIGNLGTEKIGNNIEIQNLIVLEGDWTNKEVPESITGIESAGEKENKILILSHNKNLLNPNKLFLNNSSIIKENGVFICPANVSWQSEKIMGVDLSKPLYFAYEIKSDENIIIDESNQSMLIRLDYAKTGGNVGETNIPIGTKITNKYTKVIFKNISLSNTNREKGINLQFRNGVGKKMYIRNITISNAPIDDVIPYQQDKKEILLPIDEGLKSLPNGVADTIEQRTDGVYLVQRVGKTIINGSNYTLSGYTLETSGLGRAYIRVENLKVGGASHLLSNEVQFVKWNENPWLSQNECVSKLIDFPNIYIYLKNCKSTDDMKNSLNNRPITVYYELDIPIETKLNINNLNLEVYKDTTYITTDNAIQPTLSFKIPSNIGGMIQANTQNINKLYKLIDEVIIPQLINNSADIEVLKLK